MVRGLQRIVVIEDDAALRAAIARVMRSWGARVAEAGTAAEAKLLLASSPPPDLVLLDVRLPDDSAFDVLEAAARHSSAPTVIAMSGVASPEEAFRLGQRGVRAYLPKPFSIDALAETVEVACGCAPDLDPLIRATVGYVGMRDVQRQVRSVMLHQALALTRGSLSGAARLLKVSRQAIQQMLPGLEPGLQRAAAVDAVSTPGAAPEGGPRESRPWQASLRGIPTGRAE